MWVIIFFLYLAWDLFSLSVAIMQNKNNEKAIKLAFAFLKVLIIYIAVPTGCMWLSLAFLTNNRHIQHILLRRWLYLYFIIFGHLNSISSKGTWLAFSVSWRIFSKEATGFNAAIRLFHKLQYHIRTREKCL